VGKSEQFPSTHEHLTALRASCPAEDPVMAESTYLSDCF